MNKTSVLAKPPTTRHAWTKAFLAVLMVMITAGQIISPSGAPMVKSQPQVGATACTFPPSGLVGWWPGDGNAHDIAGPNDGTLVNGATLAPGKVGQAFSLNGAGQQYINVGSSTTFDVLNFTIDAWVHIDPATNFGEVRVISRDDVIVVPASSRQLFVLKSSSRSESGGADGHAVFAILKSGVLNDVSSPTALTAGWHHIAGVRSGSTLSVYVDGVVVATATSSITGTISPMAPLVIGQVSPALNTEFFSGLIDEVDIFDRALSTSEIQAIFSADTAGKCKPVANWMFDEGSGTTTYDRSGNGNNGTLVNGPAWVLGVAGNALSFTGSNYVQIPDSQSLNITGNQFSITAWVNPRAQSNPFADIVSKRSGLFTQYFLWENWDSARRQVDFATGLYNGTNVYVSSPVFHALNNWYQVAAVYNGTRLRLFVDGNLEIDQRVTGNLVHLNVPVTIGFSSSPFNYYFNGTVDDVRIYNTALSQSDIITLLLRRAGEMARVRIGATPVGVGVNPNTNTVYASAYSSNNVSVINGITAQVMTAVNIALPIGIGVNTVTDTIYVVHGPVSQAGALSVINGTTNTITADVPVGTNPQYVGLDLSMNKAYVTNAGSGTVSVLDIGTSPPSVTSTVTVGAYPLDVAVNQNTHQVYVANANSGTVSVINGSASPPTVTTTITVGSSPFGIVVDPVTNKIYVANHGSSTVSIINGSATPPTVISTFNVASPVGLGLNPTTNEMYAVNDATNTVTVIDVSSNPPLAIDSVTVGSTSVGIGYGVGGVGVNPAISRIYTANYGENTLSVIDGHRKTTASIICSPSKVYVNQKTTCTATVADTSPGTIVTPSGSVSFTTSGTGTFSSAASCTLSGMSASASCSVSYTPAAAGNHTIGVSYGGDAGHAGSSASPPFAQEAIVTASVGGVVLPVDKLALLGLYIGIPTLILIFAVALVVYIKRGRREDSAERLSTL